MNIQICCSTFPCVYSCRYNGRYTYNCRWHSRQCSLFLFNFFRVNFVIHCNSWNVGCCFFMLHYVSRITVFPLQWECIQSHASHYLKYVCKLKINELKNLRVSYNYIVTHNQRKYGGKCFVTALLNVNNLKLSTSISIVHNTAFSLRIQLHYIVFGLQI